jgi:hypothetical protein
MKNANVVTKSQQARDLIKAKPHLTANQVAREVGCHVSMVYEVKKGGFMKATITKKAKAKAVKVGRPTKASVEANLLVSACNVLENIVKEIKDFCVTFDHAQDKVEIFWGDELYNTPTGELPRIVESIKYLESRKKQYN